MKFAQFCTVVDYWEQHADQDGSEEAAEARKARRDVYLVPSPDGYLGKMNLDPIGGAIVVKELKRDRRRVLRGRLGRGQRAPRA